MQTSATDVFVSYKAEDRARLRPLVDALEAEGFSVWWDAHIGGGSHWREDIQEHLDAAKCVVVAWTKRSVGREGNFVRDEATRAQRRGAYLPVCLDAVDPPLGFGEVQALSLKGWRGNRADPRFQAVAHAVRSRMDGEGTCHAPAHFHQPGVSRRTAILGGAGLAIVAAGVGGWLLLKPAPANAKRIAVMAFDNLSGDPAQAYFAEGIAEELRSALSRVGMQVIGRASCDAVKSLDIKAAASKLGVANILTGSVRRSPETIRVEAQLVSGSDGVQHWQQSYDRAPGDAIKIQTDIAENVASALSVALGQAGRAALTLGGTADAMAQDLILQSRNLGRQFGGADSYRRRLALAEAAISRDPNYVDAYVEKADVLSNLAVNYAPTLAEVAEQLAQADGAARKAVAIAPRSGSARMALAIVASNRLDFRGVLGETKAALALSPNDPEVLAYGSGFLAQLESADEGVRLADRGIALDPLGARFYRFKSEVLIYSRRYADAIVAGRKALQLAPERHNTHIFVGDALLLRGRSAEAKVEYEAVGANNPFQRERLALLAARTGDRAEAERLIGDLKQQIGATGSYQYGEIYAQLGDKDRAFAEFGNGIQTRDPGLIYLKVDPFLDPIRGDPRYTALLKRLNFP
jgi:serine/threonine-protein kinase